MRYHAGLSVPCDDRRAHFLGLPKEYGEKQWVSDFDPGKDKDDREEWSDKYRAELATWVKGRPKRARAIYTYFGIKQSSWSAWLLGKTRPTYGARDQIEQIRREWSDN